MAFEVFDDVAFAYLLTSFLTVLLLPWTWIKLRSFKKTPKSAVANPAGGGSKPRSLKDSDSFSQYFTFSNIVFVFSWILFVLMIVQVTAVRGTELASFKPFEILEIDAGATDVQIKRAYRKLSLKWHPDKNVNNPEAEQKFILISKAYATLTDPAAKENIEKYGNPDGYQGVSVTIGLPSFLTKKENEMRILLVYFLIFLVIPPIVVYLWWRRANLFTEGGVFQRSIQAYYVLMNPNMGPKQLIELLAVSEENSVIFTNWTAQQQSDYEKLFSRIKESMTKQKFYDPTGKKLDPRARYIHRASVIIHAHMLRVEIPQSLKPALHHILETAPKLLNAMTETALHRGFLRCLFGVVDLMQMLTQSMWIHDSPLTQLPNIDAEHAKALNKKSVYTIGGFRRATATPEGREKLKAALISAKLELSDSEWNQIYQAAELFPEMGFNYVYGVEDETSICEGDIITVKVDLERLAFDASRPEDTTKRTITDEGDDDESESKEVAASPSSAAKKAAAAKPASAASPTAKKSADTKSDAPESALGDLTVSGSSSSAPFVVLASSKADDDLEDDDLTEDELLDRLPTAPKKALFQDRTAPLVHATRYPFEKNERWTVFLVQKGKKAPKLVTFSKVPPFLNREHVNLKFAAPLAADAVDGLFEFELHVLCDSYVGCDRLAKFTIPIQKKKLISADEKLAADQPVIPKSWLAQMMEDDPNYKGEWYYLGFASFWELLLNIVVMGLLCVFIFNFLFSRGYWQRYVQPSVDTAKNVLHPYWEIVEPYVAPVSTPVITATQGFIVYLAEKLHAEPPPPKRRSGSRTARAEQQAEEEDAARKAQQEADAAARAAERQQGTEDEYDEEDDGETAAADAGQAKESAQESAQQSPEVEASA